MIVISRNDAETFIAYGGEFGVEGTVTSRLEWAGKLDTIISFDTSQGLVQIRERYDADADTSHMTVLVGPLQHALLAPAAGAPAALIKGGPSVNLLALGLIDPDAPDVEIPAGYDAIVIRTDEEITEYSLNPAGIAGMKIIATEVDQWQSLGFTDGPSDEEAPTAEEPKTERPGVPSLDDLEAAGMINAETAELLRDLGGDWPTRYNRMAKVFRSMAYTLTSAAEGAEAPNLDFLDLDLLDDLEAAAEAKDEERAEPTGDQGGEILDDLAEMISLGFRWETALDWQDRVTLSLKGRGTPLLPACFLTNRPTLLEAVRDALAWARENRTLGAADLTPGDLFIAPAPDTTTTEPAQ